MAIPEVSPVELAVTLLFVKLMPFTEMNTPWKFPVPCARMVLL